MKGDPRLYQAAKELFQRERFIGEIYEPYGSAEITQAALDSGNGVFTTNLAFLEQDNRCTHVVCEPVAELGEAYARKAISLVTGKVGLLLPVIWMASPQVKKLFEETPIARIYILTRRLRYRKSPLAWYLWEKGQIEGPKIKWI